MIYHMAWWENKFNLYQSLTDTSRPPYAQLREADKSVIETKTLFAFKLSSTKKIPQTKQKQSGHVAIQREAKYYLFVNTVTSGTYTKVSSFCGLPKADYGTQQYFNTVDSKRYDVLV